MIQDALIQEYFNLSDERREEILTVVKEHMMNTFDDVSRSMGDEGTKELFLHTLTKEKKNAQNEENYEYCELLNKLIEHLNDASTKS